MAVTETYTGANGLMQLDLLHDYFELDGDQVLFVPGDNTGPLEACFRNTCHPAFDNVSWIQAKLNLTIQALASNPNFEAVVSLLGITENGDPEIISENILNSISTTAQTILITKDLASSAGKASLKKVGTVASGIQLNLPMRYQNFEYLKYQRLGVADNTRCKVIPITGSPDGLITNDPVEITVYYDSDMKSDFSDLRFAIWDGQRLVPCCYYLLSKTNSSTATFRVRIPTIQQSIVTNIYMFYGNPLLTSASNGLNTFSFFYDFENGSYSGWTLRGGAVSVTSTSPINGTYSIKHAGDGTDNTTNRMYRSVNKLPKLTAFKFKCTVQGTATLTPYIWLWILRYVDGNNYMALQTYYDSGTNKQLLKVIKVEGGTGTVFASSNWLTGKLPINTVFNFLIIDSGTSISVINKDSGNTLINTSYSTNISPGIIGFGANLNTTCMWDDIWAYVPNITINTSPSIGAASSEYNVGLFDPNAGNDEDMSITFPLNTVHPSCIVAKEHISSEYKTSECISKGLDMLEMGFNGIDQYDALAWLINLNAGNDVYFRVNWSQIIHNPVI